MKKKKRSEYYKSIKDFGVTKSNSATFTESFELMDKIGMTKGEGLGKIKRTRTKIKHIMKILTDLWLENPNLRFCQLIGNCFISGDMYYIEDETLIEMLRIRYGQPIKLKKRKGKK